jgi:hypothetical protein
MLVAALACVALAVTIALALASVVGREAARLVSQLHF